MERSQTLAMPPPLSRRPAPEPPDLGTSRSVRKRIFLFVKLLPATVGP